MQITAAVADSGPRPWLGDDRRWRSNQRTVDSWEGPGPGSVQVRWRLPQSAGTPPPAVVIGSEEQVVRFLRSEPELL